ncbi:MAG: class I lanthipeptide [Phycisphaerales bacterium]|nr:class I lanthipeptide [Phycisphaerales bacterium]
MKKIKLNAAKLQLNKEKVKDLSSGQLSRVLGGGNSVGRPDTVIVINLPKSAWCIDTTGGPTPQRPK